MKPTLPRRHALMSERQNARVPEHLASSLPTQEATAEESEPPGTEGQRAPSDSNNAHAGASSRVVLAPPPAKKPVKLRDWSVVSPAAREFYRRFYPDARAQDYNDWGWQLRQRIKHYDHLKRIFSLSAEEEAAFAKSRDSLPLGITPYYASLLDLENAMQPLRRTVIPIGGEHVTAPGEARDPLGEDGHSPVPGLVHRYPDRVLFLVSAFCSVYCRYCTRSRVVGNFDDYRFSKAQWDKAIEYIERTPQVRDVLISGGDPLDLPDEKLDYLLGRLRAIPHVEFVRLGTKVPTVLPQRVTRPLTRMLKKHHPLWMSIHFTHPGELTPETAEACARLADAGVPLGSQTVLLKDVNDDIPTMKSLMHGLLKIRVKPYYLYQCDPIVGSAHFRTSIEKGLEIIQGLRGHTTGYAVPTYVVDAPGGGGKIPLMPEYLVGREGTDVVLRNFEGRTFRYPDPDSKIVKIASMGEAPQC